MSVVSAPTSSVVSSHVETSPAPVVNDAAKDFANELQSKVIAIELNTSRFGRSRQIDVRHRDGVAEFLETKKESTSTSKRLYPKNQPQVKKVNSILGEARATWIRMTIGYRKGIRLLKRDHLKDFIREMEAITAELDAALAELDENYDAVIEEAKESLGEKLFDINDYPESFRGHVKVSWHVHNFEPSEDLLKLAPETYERERQRVARTFELAVAGFEQESREQLSGLIDALLDKLNPPSGKKVVYTESATTNLREFFDRFKSLGINNDQQLNELITDAENALGGTTMGQLKKSAAKRRDINESFKKVKDRLDDLVVSAPLRAIDLDDLD